MKGAVETGPEFRRRETSAVFERLPAGIRRRSPQLVRDWLRFNAVGIVGIGVQLSVLAALRSGLGWPVTLATIVAVECAVIHNFIWHERWTWAYRQLSFREVPRRLLRFNLSNGLVSIVGNVILMQILAVWLNLNYLLANLTAILVCSIVNFLVSDRFVFRQAQEKSGAE